MTVTRSYIAVLLAFALLMAGCAGSKKTGKTPTKEKATAESTTPKSEVDILTEQQIFIDAAKAKTIDDIQLATELYKQVLKLNPHNDAANYELAQIYFNAGKNNDAKGYITQAVLYDSLNYIHDYIDSVLKKDSKATAKTLTSKAQAAYRANKWYMVLQADVSSSLADYTKAMAVYQKLLTQYPTELDYYFDWAYAEIKAGKYQEALKIYDKLESMLGLEESIIVQKEKLYLQMGQLDNAVKELKRLVDSDPDNIRYYQLLADVYTANDKYDEAIKVFEDLLKISPGNPFAVLNLAGIYQSKNDHGKYMEYLRMAFANVELGVDAKIRVMFPYMEAIGPDSAKRIEAFELAKIMVATHPDDARVHALYADMYFQIKDEDSALKEYQISLKKDSSTFEVWQQIFFIQTNKKQYADLAALSEKAQEMFPNQPLVYFFNGLANYQLKEFQKSVNSLKAANTLAIDNKSLKVQIYSTLGDAYNSLSKYAASDSAFDAALVLDKNNSYVLNNYSYYLSLRSSKLDRAKEMSLKSNELEPANASFQDTYAWVLFKKGEYAEAKIWIEKAIAHTEGVDATLFEHFGDILYKLGDTEKALENWQKAANLGSDSKLLDKKIADKKLYE